MAAILSRVPPRIGSFRLVAQLGEGGFAPVYLAVEEHGGVELRSVALKLFGLDDLERLGVGAGATATAQNRIIEEARALCRVEHPNIVRFFQLIEDEMVLGLVMEHVRGTPLHATIEAEGGLGVETTLAIGAATASALAAVHAAGLVHRDIKPDNLIQTSGQLKLIDFGIAARYEKRARREATVTEVHPADAPERTLVMTGATVPMDRVTSAAEAEAGLEDIAGTMGYIDPECLGHGQPADATSDLYALGATLYECLSGRLPASVGGGPEVTLLRMPIALGNNPPPPLRHVAPYVPEEVAQLIDALVDPRRSVRPKRAEWVATELERLRRLTRMGLPRSLPPGGPFRGLDAFTENDRDILMGRAAELASAVDVLRVRGVLALVGASGSGKTSFARAAVAPAILEGALGTWPPRWTTITLNPGPDPRRSLAQALGVGEEMVGLATTLGRKVENENVGIVILIDALEELVTLASAETRAPLVDLLEDLAANPRPGVRAIVTLRRDLLDPLLEIPGLGQALTRGAQLVAPLSAVSQALALEERLAAYGFALEDAAMREALARELATTAESMPLVEFALARLWAERDEARRILPRAALARIGGIAGALEQHAESTVRGLESRFGPSIVDVVRRVLLSLTTPQGTRTRATPEEIVRAVADPRRDEVIQALERARLTIREEQRMTLAHEALLLQWSRLRVWTQDARRDRELIADVEQAAGRWNAAPSRDLLLRGRVLEDARRLGQKAIASYSDGARKFIGASRANEMRGFIGVAGLIVSVLLGIAIFSLLYVDTQRQAEKEKQAARLITSTLISARNTPESERAAAVAKLLEEKKACEKELAKCSVQSEIADAGASD